MALGTVLVLNVAEPSKSSDCPVASTKPDELRIPTSCNTRARSRATVVLPQPGLPTKEKLKACLGVTRALGSRFSSARTSSKRPSTDALTERRPVSAMSSSSGAHPGWPASAASERSAAHLRAGSAPVTVRRRSAATRSLSRGTSTRHRHRTRRGATGRSRCCFGGGNSARRCLAGASSPAGRLSD